MNYLIGAHRADITPAADGVAMMGWGDQNHLVKGVATPLYARAIAMVHPETKTPLVMLCLDICFISEALRQTLMKYLNLKEEQLIVSATHTHSAPGGFSSSVLYSLTNDGFLPEVFGAYLKGSIEAVETALKNVRPGTLRFAAGSFETYQPVAFNRSIRAWNRNPEVQKYSRSERHLAVDREMSLIRFDDENGKPIAFWNWFPVHATSIHRDHFKIHSDNKGMAAAETEEYFKEQGNENFVAVFAQGAAGDVSPNFRWFLRLREKRGVDREDEISCKLNSNLQRQKAIELFEEAAKSEPLAVQLESILEYIDFSAVKVDPDFVNGRTGLHTGPAEVGIPQLYGTAEGRGASYPMVVLMQLTVRICQWYNFFADLIQHHIVRSPWRDDAVQGRKITVMAPGKSEIFETGRIEKLVFPDWFHPMIATLRRWAKRGVLKQRPFSSPYLPLQITRIGNLVIASVPAEFTTVSGWRLKKTLEIEFQKTIPEVRILIQGYANAYSSYVTTPEEYVQQSYEGGCTHFGKWTLPAYLTEFRKLSRKMIDGKSATSFRPPAPTPEYWKAILHPKADLKRAQQLLKF